MLDTTGEIICTGAAKVLEDVDGDGDDPTGETPVTAELGCGHCTEFGSTWHGADREIH